MSPTGRALSKDAARQAVHTLTIVEDPGFMPDRGVWLSNADTVQIPWLMSEAAPQRRMCKPYTQAIYYSAVLIWPLQIQKLHDAYIKLNR
jgi:hypothetical protein